MSSFAISRQNVAASQEKKFLELGLQDLRDNPFVAQITSNPEVEHFRLVYADWLEEQGKAEEAFVLRAIAAGRDVKFGDSYTNILDHGSRHGERVPLFGCGRWSVVRRVTEGANGGHRHHYVSWARLTVEVVRLTEKFAILADGKRVALDTLSACVRLD